MLKGHNQQREIEERADKELAILAQEVNQERLRNGWMHDLITSTDSALVSAVRNSLEVLGFSDVVDVDVERDREGKSRREDLQIRESSPTIIIDIKGISGYPSDDDALQADKHAAIRMREQARTDIVGLSIINHQRHLPPLERENVMPFRQELLDAAEERTLGLMTAWDLYRIVRNSNKLGWTPAVVKPLFYKKGRIEVVPNHYRLLGVVQKAWSAAFGIVTQGELKLGDRVAVEFSIEFEEFQVDSIKIDNQSVEQAVIGDRVGLVWAGRGKIREGMRVFRVER